MQRSMQWLNRWFWRVLLSQMTTVQKPSLEICYWVILFDPVIYILFSEIWLNNIESPFELLSFTEASNSLDQKLAHRAIIVFLALLQIFNMTILNSQNSFFKEIITLIQYTFTFIGRFPIIRPRQSDRSVSPLSGRETVSAFRMNFISTRGFSDD